MDNLTWFWLWWGLTVGLVAWQIAGGLLDAKRALGFPVIAGLMWLYIYGLLPFSLIQSEAAMPPILPLAQFLPFAAYASLLIGWNLRLSRSSQLETPYRNAPLDAQKLSNAGVGLALAGMVGYLSFQTSGQALSESSAYWYLLFHVCYPGISICVATMTISPSPGRLRNLVLSGLSTAPVVLSELGAARRGPTFAAIIAITYSYLLVRPRLPRPTVLLGILGASGAIMLFLVTARSIVYHDGTWGEALSTISISDVFEEHATCTADNEYYNHCLLVEADQLTGRYQYGTAHLAVMLNWIPRQIWADKPARNKGFFPAAMDAFQSGKGNNLGHGGAWGPVADSFDNYWFLFPLFWLGVGYGIAAIYVRAFQENSLRWKLRYVGVLCATHWFISQSLAEAFVPAMIYQGAYFLAFWCAAPGHVPDGRKPAQAKES